MLADIFFLDDITHQTIVDNMWGGDGDTSYFYSDTEASAEFALAMSNIFSDIEFYGLESEKEGLFFVYVKTDGEMFDVSGFHLGTDSVINDNEFYSDQYGKITEVKLTRQDVIEISRTTNVMDLVKIMLGNN